MQLGEIIHLALSYLSPDRCPFCTDPEDDATHVTYKGDANSSGNLRANMNNGGLRGEGDARPKDGEGRRQAPDPQIENPDPIFADATTLHPGLSGPVGRYGNEAHHSISGNECMDGESIEEIIKCTDGKFEKDTGYSINNAANGVFLPSWERARWGTGKPDGKWKDQDDDIKYEIMKLAMRGLVGQAHIGSHDGKVTAKHPDSYPEFVKAQLAAIKDRVMPMSEKCPNCNEDNEPKDPLPPPYGVNNWLDVLSREVTGHLTSHPRTWTYFVSEYAAQYHNEVCRHGTVAQVLPDNWPAA